MPALISSRCATPPLTPHRQVAAAPLDDARRLKYFPALLVQYANTLLKDRMLFGSDYPLITPERWMKDFDEAGFTNKVKPLILKENAKRLLGFS